jgi:hypothetical protein
MFLYNLLNVLVQIANKMGLQKKILLFSNLDIAPYLPQLQVTTHNLLKTALSGTFDQIALLGTL